MQPLTIGVVPIHTEADFLWWVYWKLDILIFLIFPIAAQYQDRFFYVLPIIILVEWAQNICVNRRIREQIENSLTFQNYCKNLQSTQWHSAQLISKNSTLKEEDSS